MDKVKYNVSESGCWEAYGRHISKRGYPMIFHDGKTQTVARYSYIFHFGEIAKGSIVMHKCDNPKCCNPEHLILGTYKDNSEDMCRKGRQNKNEKNGSAKLTEIDVKLIRIYYQLGKYTQYELSKMFKIRQTSISNIINNKTWTQQ